MVIRSGWKGSQVAKNGQKLQIMAQNGHKWMDVVRSGWEVWKCRFALPLKMTDYHFCVVSMPIIDVRCGKAEAKPFLLVWGFLGPRYYPGPAFFDFFLNR